jgi:uncharacterized FlaG/YvyC family protein
MLKQIYFILLSVMCFALSAQAKWEKAKAQDLLLAINQSKAFISNTPTLAFKVLKTIATADAKHEVLANTQIIFKRNEKLLWVKSKEIEIKQNAQYLLTIDSNNKTIVVDKPIDLGSKSLLGSDMDALIQTDMKDIQKLVSPSQLQFQFKYRDEADTTMNHLVLLVFDKKTGQMIKSINANEKADDYQVSAKRLVHAKMQMETVFVPLVNVTPLSEQELGLNHYIKTDVKNKVTLEKKYSKYKFLDQRAMRN